MKFHPIQTFLTNIEVLRSCPHWYYLSASKRTCQQVTKEQRIILCFFLAPYYKSSKHGRFVIHINICSTYIFQCFRTTLEQHITILYAKIMQFFFRNINRNPNAIIGYDCIVENVHYRNELNSSSKFIGFWIQAVFEIKVIGKIMFFPLPLKLRESEIWDIALRAKSLTLGRIQTSLVLLSLIWDIKDFSSLIFLMLGRVQASLTLLSLIRKIEFLMFVIFCRCHFLILNLIVLK